MYAHGHFIMPAFAIYEEKILKEFESQIKCCHIYLIGSLPKVDFIGATQENRELITTYKVLGVSYDLRWPMPEEATLMGEAGGPWYVINQAGEKVFPSAEAMMCRLSNECNAQNFEVLYIGQAFGDDGSRNALDRLKKHETLQKISLKGLPSGYGLNLLLLEIQRDNRMITLFNPWAKNKDDGEERISKGIDKLNNTSEAERITLYEASLIRYFKPKFNKEFKNSFPSTNMKLLKDCYDKDIAAISAEICIDTLPFKLFTDAVSPKLFHIANHDLHDAEDRKVFFGGTS